MKLLKQYWNEKPLLSLLVIAFLARLVAVFFAQGYAFHDDHFLVIDAAQSWVGQHDWNNWMPEVQKQMFPDQEPIPQGHSLLYPGLHYLLFLFFEWLGVFDPQLEMLLVRFLHAIISLWVVGLGYRMTEHYTNDKIARKAGLFLALIWFFPFMGVRNLVEVICIPFLMWGTWEIVKLENLKKVYWPYFLVGLILGVTFSFRYQTIVYAGGIGLVILFRKKWLEALLLGTGVFLSIAFFQGIIDVFIWKKPFAELTEYVVYNIQHRNEYGVNNYYMYLSILAGMVTPPLGLYLLFGWFRSFKQFALLFWPSFLFFLFHTIFPNKQERFILPIIPMFVVVGTLGWWLFIEKSGFWQRNMRLFKYSMVFFWIVNTFLWLITTTTYSKKSRCEAMVYLGKQPDATHIIVEESARLSVTQMPTFYAGKDLVFYNLPKKEAIDTLILTSQTKPFHSQNIPNPEFIEQKGWPKPEYALFVNENNLDFRTSELKKSFPDMELIQIIEPSYIDLLMKKITPSNNNQNIFVYRLN